METQYDGGDIVDPLAVGIQAGLVRAARYNLLRTVDRRTWLIPPDNTALVRSVDLAEDVLRNEAASAEGGVSSRFTEFFGEMVTVAALARDFYGDPPLTNEEMAAYVQLSFSFFNSFRHA
jgi:hypothetical protein